MKNSCGKGHMLVRNLRTENAQESFYGKLAAKNVSPLLAGKTRRIPRRLKYLSILLEQVDDNDDLWDNAVS